MNQAVNNQGMEVPTEIVDHAIAIERLMKQAGHTDWVFMGLASRSAYEKLAEQLRESQKECRAALDSMERLSAEIGVLGLELKSLMASVLKVTTEQTLEHMRGK